MLKPQARQTVYRLALAQLSASSAMDDNLARALAAMERAAENNADVILFPEIQLGPFFPQYKNFDAAPYALDIDHPIIGEFRAACRRLNLIAAPNVYLAEAGKFYDASILIGCDGSILGISKMVHITDAPGFYEQDYYAPSDEGFRVFETAAGRIGMIICFDRHYPESFRTMVLQGAEIILISTANTAGEPIEMFEMELRVAAFQNSVAIAMCNRVGQEGEAAYAGRSVVVGPGGEIVMRTDDSEGIFYADYDLSAIQSARRENKFLELYDAANFTINR